MGVVFVLIFMGLLYVASKIFNWKSRWGDDIGLSKNVLRVLPDLFKDEALLNDFKIILNKLGFNKIIHSKKIINNSGNFTLKIDRKILKIINYLFTDDFSNFKYKIVS